MVLSYYTTPPSSRTMYAVGLGLAGALLVGGSDGFVPPSSFLGAVSQQQAAAVRDHHQVFMYNRHARLATCCIFLGGDEDGLVIMDGCPLVLPPVSGCHD